MKDEKLLVFDTEATGPNPERDQIIELSLQEGLDPKAPAKTWRIKPAIPISPAATAVHGISNEDVADCPPFEAVCAEITPFFEKADYIMGYNVEYDLTILCCEMRRCKLAELDLSEKRFIDPLMIWRKLEPRRLSDAHERFVGKPLKNAHTAEADVKATAAVLLGMQQHFDLKACSLEDLALLSLSRRAAWIGPSKHIQWKDGQVVIAFGKHSGTPLTELACDRANSYLRWVTTKDFPDHVKSIAQEAMKRPADEFLAWVEECYGKQPER